jgi:hypothetical protein
MSRPSRRIVLNHQPGLPDSRTKIDVFKPNGPETFVEAGQILPHLTGEHQEGAGGLFDDCGLKQVDS